MLIVDDKITVVKTSSGKLFLPVVKLKMENRQKIVLYENVWKKWGQRSQ